MISRWLLQILAATQPMKRHSFPEMLFDSVRAQQNSNLLSKDEPFQFCIPGIRHDLMETLGWGAGGWGPYLKDTSYMALNRNETALGIEKKKAKTVWHNPWEGMHTLFLSSTSTVRWVLLVVHVVSSKHLPIHVKCSR